MKQAYFSAYGMAMVRAMESLFTESEIRLFEDPYAALCLSGINKFYLELMKNKIIYHSLLKKNEKQYPGVLGGLLCRTCYYDEISSQAVEDGMEAIVNLGAGMDTRCIRITGMDQLKYYEVDHPIIQSRKIRFIKKLFGKIPKHLIFVPVDFNRQTLNDELAKAGYSRKMKTFFHWEGVTQYITKGAIKNVLHYISHAFKGSRVAFSYVLKDFIKGTGSMYGLEKMHKRLCTGKEPLWKTGLNPSTLKDFLAGFSIALKEDNGPSYHKVNYLNPIERKMEVMEIERIILGERA